MLVTLPSLEESVGVLQASVAVAVPNALFISPADGLHPSVVPVPPVVIVGGVLSAAQFAVREAVDVLPHSSIALNVLVWDCWHPFVVTGPSVAPITVAPPQASVAEAVPKAALISPADGLQRLIVDPPTLITGPVTSDFHVTVRDAVAVLPQASLAVNVLV